MLPWRLLSNKERSPILSTCVCFSTASLDELAICQVSEQPPRSQGLSSHCNFSRSACLAGLSCALFAPGWVWEEAHPRGQWRERSVRLWDRLQDCSYRHRPPRPVVLSLPFSSSFGQGCGLFDCDQVGFPSHCQSMSSGGRYSLSGCSSRTLG